MTIKIVKVKLTEQEKKELEAIMKLLYGGRPFLSRNLLPDNK